MPFTPAHVAAVLPVLGRRSSWVVPAAWVVGSMSPDLVYYLPVGWVRPLSHSFVGLVALDLPLAVAVLLAWWCLVSRAVRDLAPRGLRTRVPVSGVPALTRWPWVVVGVLAGGLTHLAWDAFTHADGWVVERVAGLREPLVGGQAAYSVLQEVSGVVGLGAVGLWAWAVSRRAPAVHDPSEVLSTAERAGTWTVAAVVPLALCAVLTVRALPAQPHAVNALFVGFTRSVGLTLALVLLAAGAWHRLRRRRQARVSTPV